MDATGGNDANDGLTTATAWQTIAKVNAGTFFPGDKILFKRGETWSGTSLLITWSGDEGNPIYFGDYGAGALPIIDGADTVHCSEINNQHFIKLENLDLTQGVGAGIYCHNNSYGIEIVNCYCHDAGNDGLLFIDGCYNCTVTGGRFYANYQSAAYRITGIEVAEGCHDITIDGAECDNNLDNAAGVAVFSHNAADDVVPANILIKNCNIHDNAVYAILVSKQDPNPNPAGFTVILQNNTIVGTIFTQGDVTIEYL